MIKTIAAITFVYLVAVAGWVTLGNTISYRTDHQDSELKQQVGELWGTPLVQKAPSASLAVGNDSHIPQAIERGALVVRGASNERYDLPLVENDIHVAFNLEQRQKGLLWYSTYHVRFSGDYVFENTQDKSGELIVSFAFPSVDGQYDDFKFELDGSQAPFTRQNGNQLVAHIPCAAKSRHKLSVNYYSLGLDRFTYRFGEGISEVRNFKLVATTDFGGYDFPSNTLSPNAPKERLGNGWQLVWEYKDLISGTAIGFDMPQKINPGPMAARISFFAPVSLGFFFFLIFVISMLRGMQIHPMNYFFLAAAFFAFHLLLAYLVDHISIHAAFVLCSMVSIILVVSYMRIVAGNRFAFLEVALAQLVYLIGFSYAFFFEGFTGLAVTIGSIITLFVVMQSTARINWADRFALINKTDIALNQPNAVTPERV
jgi:hypothetical protein